MFIRWKEGSGWLRASIVRSVRLNGKPRQEIIGSISVKQDAEEKEALAWNTFEDYLAKLDLPSSTREKIIHSFARRIPRPSDEELEQRKQKSAMKEAQRQVTLRALMGDGWEERLAANVVPNEPPLLVQDSTTDDTKSPFYIKWKVEQARTKFEVPAKYTAFLAKRNVVDGREKQEIITKLNSEAIAATLLKKEVEYNGKVVVHYAWKAFWYDVHRHLVLAHVDLETYHNVMLQLSRWVVRPTQEELLAIVLKQIAGDRWHLDNKEKELSRAIDRCYRERMKLDKIQSQNSAYFM